MAMIRDGINSMGDPDLPHPLTDRVHNDYSANFTIRAKRVSDWQEIVLPIVLSGFSLSSDSGVGGCKP
jgi:hypothetical protein